MLVSGLLALVISCSAPDVTGPTATPSPADVAVTPVPTGAPTPAPSPSATPTVEASSPGFDLVYREFGPFYDTIWQVNSADPRQREQIASIEHTPECATFSSLSPDGDALAYTVLTRGSCLPTDLASAFVQWIGEPSQILVKDRVILQTAPLWSPDSRSVYLVGVTENGFVLMGVNVESGESQALLTIDALGLRPVGFGADGVTLYYAQIDRDGGTSIGAYNIFSDESGSLLRVSDAIGRDFSVSPDGQRIAVVASGQILVVDLISEDILPLSSDLLAGTTLFQPTWHPNGSLAIGQLPGGDEASPAVMIDLGSGDGVILSAPESGFDIPLDWSPDGRILVVRSFPDVELGGTDSRRLELVGEDGERLIVSEEPEVAIVGWR